MNAAEREKLVELLKKTGAFQYSPDKQFELASGAKSSYYFDLRLLNGDPEGISTVARVLYDTIKMSNVKSVGGLESGSISIATAIAQHSYTEHQKDPANPLITAFYVRKAAKQHGTKKMIEGKIASPVVVVDDVVTSGMSAVAAIQRVRESGHDCKMLLAILFRGTKEQRQKIEKECKLEYILHKDHVI